eukprot:TRINITY_DN13555_c0_g1_i2.p1 TRINITY_DN13555_c0_g1~~TRINITY_DN13555_c0_g1_i2.p1  ORF type:complete len:286 (+),score=42.27 TRINITY_DN13555_c0_g1_i2:202-1059(+)
MGSLGWTVLLGTVVVQWWLRPRRLRSLRFRFTDGGSFMVGNHRSGSHITMPYALFRPDGTRPTTLVLYLHGANGRGDEPRELLNQPLLRMMRARIHPWDVNKRCVVLAPQVPRQRGVEWRTPWVMQAVHELMAAVLADFIPGSDPILVVTGASMGGLGCWDFVARAPPTCFFAAAAPICGGGAPVFAPLVKKTKFWFFHAESDSAIGVSETRALVKAATDQGVNVSFSCFTDEMLRAWHTERPDAAALAKLHHASYFGWSHCAASACAYCDPRLKRWLESGGQRY